MTTLLFLTALLMAEQKTPIVKTHFQLPEEVVLTDPHFMDFGLDGSLYVLERNNPRVLYWGADGSYQGHFGQQGQGPGEMNSPQLIHVTTDKVWVWGRDGRFSIFDLKGNFLSSFQSGYSHLRRFAVINDNLLLVAHQVRESWPYMVFELMDAKGTILERVKKITNGMFLTAQDRDNSGLFKAYGPEVDIHSDKKGTVWFGFSQEQILYRMDREGKIVERRTIEIPQSKPTEQEKQDVLDIRIALPNGRIATLKDIPDVRLSFDYEKSAYTHFMIKGDRMVSALTPISGTDINKGYALGSYYVLDFATGKPLSRGNYRYPDDSLVIFSNGRAVGFVLDDEDDLQVKELVF